jgi:transposase
MHQGKLVFAQLMSHLQLPEFHKCVKRYDKSKERLTFSYLDQFLCMTFAQLTYRESLRDIEACLRAHKAKLYHLGIRGGIARSTLADANENRDWRVFQDFALHLIKITRVLYADDRFGVDLDNTVYALDTTTIDLCLQVFPWAKFRANKGAVKLHTLLDLRGNIPTFIHITNGKVHEVNVLDVMVFEAGSFYIMDRGFLDFARLYKLHQAQAFFVIRAKSNLKCRRVVSERVDKTTGIRCDQRIRLTGHLAASHYPEMLRRIKFYDETTGKSLVFLTNNFELPPIVIAKLYKNRWQVELFFKWIKQHLRIKRFFGTSENAVKTQIWIAIAVYVLVALVKKRLKIESSLYTILQILSLSIYEKTPLNQLLSEKENTIQEDGASNQLYLFDF